METDELWSEIIQLRQLLWDMTLDYWFFNTFFSLNWWLLITASILIIIVWFLVLDKKRIIEIIAYGLFISITGFIFDLIGITMVLWSYPHRVLPILTPLIEINLVNMPIIYMLVYQYFQSWRSFIIAMTINAFVFAFVLEPILIRLGIYKVYYWEHIYSFPIYLLIGIFFKWLIIKLTQVENKHKSL